MPRLLLVDGDNLLHRCYHSLGGDAEFGAVADAFCNSIVNTAGLHECSHWVVVFDIDLPSFRKELYPQYKAQRPAKTFDVGMLRAHIKELLMLTLQCHSMEVPGFEADDVIASIAIRAHHKDIDALILTTDSDSWALVTDASPTMPACIRILKPPSRRGDEYRLIDTQAVVAKYGLLPAQLTELKMLMGDKADNIPGVPNIGIVRAKRLLHRFGDIKTLLDHLPDVGDPMGANIAATDFELMRTLVTLRADVPLPLLQLARFRIVA